MSDLPGAVYALCAFSFWKARHTLRPRFKRGKRKRQMISHYPECRAMVHAYVQKARAVGWRGTIAQAVEENNKLKDNVDRVQRFGP